jgi:hypothetical protein
VGAYHQIFVRTDKTEQEFIRDLSTAAAAEISAIEPPVNGIEYGGQMVNAIIEVEPHHEFENDRDMDFSEYPMLITVRELDSDKSREAQLAQTVFDRLAGIGGYELLFVFDLQRLLARNCR